MYIVVTGAAGFIGANLVRALNRRGETRIIAVDNLARADKCANLVDLRDRRLPRQGGIPGAPRRRRLRRRRRGDTAPGCVLRHDGSRWPVHDAQQLPLFGDAARLVPEQRRALPVRIERCGLRRRHRVPRGARVRIAAQRLRLLEVPLRPVRAQSAAGAHGADRRFPLLQRLRTARAAQGADGLRGLALLPPVREPKAGSGCSRARAAMPPASSAAISSRSRTSSRSTSISSTIRSAAASSTSAPGRRRPTMRWPPRRSTRVAPPPARRDNRSPSSSPPA